VYVKCVVQEVEISDDVKDRHLLAEDKSLRGEGDLQLTNVDFTDNGRYVCQMSNELGSFEQPVDLRILGTCNMRGSTVERWSLTGELFLSCARPIQLTGGHLVGGLA